MTETSRFWNDVSVGDAVAAPYDAPTEFAEVLMGLGAARSISPNVSGVIADGADTELAPSVTTPNISIGIGRALVYGNWYENTASLSTAIPVSGSTRYDRIVLRKSWVLQTVRITRIAGVDGAGIPAMTQSAGITWDMPLAIVLATGAVVTLVEDSRNFVPFLSNFNWPIPQLTPQNLLINPGFEVWQRGAGPFAAAIANVYTADQWFIEASPAIASVSRSTVVSPGARSRYSMQIVVTAGACEIRQRIENWAAFYGAGNFLLSARIRANGNAQVVISDGFGANYFSPYHTGGDAWETLRVRMPAAAIGGFPGLIGMAISPGVTAFIDDMILTVGGQRPEFLPLSYAEDFARCLRYFERINSNQTGGLARMSFGSGFALDTNTAQIHLNYHPKRINPTITVSAAASFDISEPAAFDAVTAITTERAGRQSAALLCDVGGAPLTAGRACLLVDDGTNDAYIDVDASL